MQLTRQCYGLIQPDGDWDRTVLLTKAVLHDLLRIVDLVKREWQPWKVLLAVEEV